MSKKCQSFLSKRKNVTKFGLNSQANEIVQQKSTQFRCIHSNTEDEQRWNISLGEFTQLPAKSLPPRKFCGKTKPAG